MQHVLTLRKIVLVFGFALVFFGCSANSGINVTATGTSEGIVLHFDNIPKDIDRIWVSLWDFYGIDSSHPIETYTAIEDNELIELRKNKDLVCPFVKSGHDYVISVYFYKDSDHAKFYKRYYIGAVADGGIYLVNSPSLYFNDEKNRITLSEKPIFSEEVVYSQESLFDYSAFVIVDKDDAMYGGGNRSNELTYDISFLANETKEHFGFTGDFPIIGSARCTLKYGKLEWGVGVANTERTIVSFQ